VIDWYNCSYMRYSVQWLNRTLIKPITSFLKTEEVKNHHLIHDFTPGYIYHREVIVAYVVVTYLQYLLLRGYGTVGVKLR